MGQRADRVAGGLIGVGAVALFASTFMHWYLGSDIEGAYFNHSAGVPAEVSVRAAGWAAAGAGSVGLALVLWRTIDGPEGVLVGLGVGAGPVVATCGLSVIAAGGAVALAARGE